MSDAMQISSHRGVYQVRFEEAGFSTLRGEALAKAHFIVDGNVAELYADELADVLTSSRALVITATEGNKALDKFPRYVEELVAQGIRRDCRLVAIGGGIIQDITCFLAATLLRGLRWDFYPTTLLAQADSCIGSKSSINVGSIKNILGTFTPPQEIVISTRVLKTLDERDVRSGLGEMLKVHIIDGPESFAQIAKDYPRILHDAPTMMQYIRRSLEIKRRIIEQDEFDTGIRNVMNYGHSFGHAIESATNFGIPHGIAVTIGMDMANYTAIRLGKMPLAHYQRMHPVLLENYRGYEDYPIPLEQLLAALGKDKKNQEKTLGLILPDNNARISRGQYENDSRFEEICRDYLLGERK